MRVMKLALIAFAALLFGSASASAITVKKRTEAPGLPPQIWEKAGAFCAIKNWHPLVADCTEEKEGDVTYRTLTLKDGGKIKEKLSAMDDLSYSYEILESPLPVQNYKAKLWFEVDDGWAFAERLARDGGALVSPGEFYGAQSPNYVCVAVVQPSDRLNLVVERLGVS